MRLKPQRLSTAAVLIAAAAAFRTVLSLAVRSLIARRFGIGSGETDAYLAAFTVPQIVGDYLVGGTIFFAFLPVFARVRTQRGEDEAWRLLASVLRLAAALLFAAAAAYACLAGPLISVLAPGFDRGVMGLATHLARFLSPALFLMGMILIGTSVIQSFRHFIVTAIGSIIAPACTLIGIVLLSGRLGIVSWAAGTVAGLLVQLLLYAWVLRAAGMTVRRALPFSDQAMRDICRLLLPMFVGILAGQANGIVQRVLASSVPAGITALHYSQLLAAVPVGLIIAPIVSALFPLLAHQAAEDTTRELRATCAMGIRMVLFLGLPAAIVLIAARKSIVAVLFQWGKFGPQDTDLISGLLVYHAVAICLLGGAIIINNALCALEQTGDLLWVNICTCLACVLHFILFRYMKIAGLALATCLVQGVAFAAGFALLSRRLGLMLRRSDAMPLAKMAVSGAATVPLAALVSHAFGGRGMLSLAATACAVSIGYLILAWIQCLPEPWLVWSRLIGKA